MAKKKKSSRQTEADAINAWLLLEVLDALSMGYAENKIVQLKTSSFSQETPSGVSGLGPTLPKTKK